MVDLPGGAWTAMLVGGYWPGAGALEILDAAALARHRSATDLHGYADQLRLISQTHLAGQDGVTADTARTLFARGEHRARSTADRNAVKRRSYESARLRVAALREDLARIAEDGNAAIDRIQRSSAPTAVKVSGIVEVIVAAQDSARAKTAEHAGSVLADIQTVLDAQGSDLGARAFAAAQGVDPSPPHPFDAETVTRHVSARLESPEATGGSRPPARGDCSPGGGSPPGSGALPHPGPTPESGPAPESETPEFDTPEPGPRAASGNVLSAGMVAAGAALAGAAEGIQPQTARPVDAPAAATSPPAAGTADPIGIAGGPSAPAPQHDGPSPAATPLGVIGAEHRPAPTGMPGMPAAAASVPATTAAPGPHAAAAHAGQPLAAPHPSGAAAAGPLTVLRRTGTPVLAGAERATASAPGKPDEDSLAPLLAAVACQQPALAWAVGVRPDGTTVLVTDLAGGWIPPRIGVPEGLRLLEPGRRGATLTDLLTGCTASITYLPGQHLPPDAPAFTVSADARTVVPVADLGWQVSQATRWRDGLPRLAHTLTRAAVTGTGWLDSEVALLREHIDAVTSRVLAGYPRSVDGTDVGNWQLLATIDALLRDETSFAAYHFTWFASAEQDRRR